ncbi:MAG: hypothetical protein S4CHLAM7_08060 [Chlamydiae bacterium]|nr:hypothetical protein [Chlamydiota bacterium]
MKLKKSTKFLLLSVLFGVCFSVYRIIYPNDFFMPHAPLKNNPDLFFKKTFKQLLVISKSDLSPDLEVLICDPDSFLEDSEGWIKNNSKRTVSIVDVGESVYFIKRYNTKNLYDYVTKCPFRSSKAFRSFFYAQLFTKEGLLTPKPLALIEKRIGIFWTSTYLIFEYKKGTTLEAFFSSNSIRLEKKLAAVKKLSDHLKILHKQRWVHRDLALRNLFVIDDNIFFLDLDDMHSYAFNNYFFNKKFNRKHLSKIQDELSHISKNSQILFSSL